LEKFKIKILVI